MIQLKSAREIDLMAEGGKILGATVAMLRREVKAGMSTIKRTGPWRVPPRIRVLSGMGSVTLDFCDAENPHPVVEIELELGAGSAKLLVPDDATANVDDLVPGMGSVHSSVPSTPQPGHPHFVVHGRTAVGSVRVRRRFRLGKYFF